eukprot:UN34462
MPSFHWGCTETIIETCSDYVKNQDETGIDCGGICKACDPATSCYDIYVKSNGTAQDDVYTIFVLGVAYSVKCDMTNGGWTKVINILGTTGTQDYAVASEWEVGSLDVDSSFSKMSDDVINEIAGNSDFWRVDCGGVRRYVTNDEKEWTSLYSQDVGWKTDRDLDGVMDCYANRANYVFADYPNSPIVGGSGDCVVRRTYEL